MYKSYPKPQNALKRAQELCAIGNYEEALELLQEVVKGKRVPRVWQKDIHEPIMQLYLQSCVRLKKSQLAKEGLYQYKALCQTVNIKSLEDVVREYLKMAKEFTEDAKARSHQSVLDIEDLDSINSPESVLMSAVSSEDTQDRTNRTVLMPWLRFLWESYRHCMDVFKNHNKLERLYHDIAREAFQFCQVYDRKTEFRRLCDNLRYHLGQVQKYQGIAATIDLSSEETLEYHTKTRLLQLETAIAMDLWLEAFRAIDDFHLLLGYYKKPPKPQTIVDYYQKFALVCFQSRNMLYHAAALLRVYVITRDYKKSFSQEEISGLSNTVLLATLTIPVQPQESWLTKYLDMGAIHTENQRRLCAVLNLAAPPTRNQLLNDLEKYGVLQYASKPLVELYHCLQTRFEPLNIHDKVLGCIEGINGIPANINLKKYIGLIEPVMVVRILKQISEIYKVIKIERLQQIMHSVSPADLQSFCLCAARNGDVQLSIDERGKCIVFGSDGGLSSEVSNESSTVQPMESEVMREMMNGVAATLEKSAQLIYPETFQQQRSKVRDCVSALYLTYRQKEHERMMERPERIEKRLEDIERECRAREEEQVREQQKRDEELRAEEEQRLAREANMREEQRKKEEVKKLEKIRLKEHLEGLKKAGGNILQDIQDEDLEEMNPNDLLARRKEELMKEQRERVEKLRKEEKKIDHWERAMREVEIPAILDWAAKQIALRKEQWDKSEQIKIDQSKEEAEKRKVMREKCILMVNDKVEFVKKLNENKADLLETKLAEWEKNLEIERAKRLAARRATRKADRRRHFLTDQKREENEAEERERRLRKEAAEEQERKEEQLRNMEERRAPRDKVARIEDALANEPLIRGSEFKRQEPQNERRYDSMNGPTRRDDGNEIRRGGSPVGNRGPPSGETRYRPPAFREDRDHRDRDYFRRNDDRNMRDGPPDREENFRPFRDDGGRRDRDIMRGGDDDSRRRDDRPPPPREDRLRDRDEMRRRDDLDSGFRRRGGADDLRRPGGGPPLGRDRDDGLRRRGDDGVDRMARGGDLFRPSMRGEGGPPPRENRDRDNFRPSQSNLGMQRGEDRDEFRRGTGFAQRDTYGGGLPRDRERDRDRDSFMPARGSEIGGIRGSERGGPPSDLRGPPGRDGGDYGRYRRGEDVHNRLEPQSAAPIRHFRATNREEKKNERPQTSEDGWTEVRKR